MQKWLLFFIILIQNSHQITLKIGALFDADNPTQAAAFETGIHLANSDIFLHLTSEIQLISIRNALNVTNSMCTLFSKGVVAVFGPNIPYVSPHVQTLCDKKEIPHLETHGDDKASTDSCLVNLHPKPEVLSQIYNDVVVGLGWEQFTVVFEDNESLLRVVGLLSSFGDKGKTILLRQLQLDERFGYRNVILGLKKSGEKRFVVDCRLEVLEEVLEQMQQIGLMTEGYHLFVTNLDFQIIDYEPFQFGGANVTGLRLFDLEDEKVKLAQKEYSLRLAESRYLSVDSALIIDGVKLFYETLEDHYDSPQLRNVNPLYCEEKDNWEFGYTIINNLKTQSMTGLTGIIKFDTEGFRSDFLIDVIELNPRGLVKVGNWSVAKGYQEQRTIVEDLIVTDESEFKLHGKHFTVIISIVPPYALETETTSALTGNDRYEGFCIDLIQELSNVLGFSYTFIVQQDGANGNYNQTTKKWDGMLGQVIDGLADLAITDLTITSERENAVDFTMPFMNLGISILYRKPEPVPPSLFMFWSPFSIGVWLLLAVAYFSVSVCLFIMGRLSPSEWTNPYPCVDEPEFLVNQLSLRNSLWFTIGSLMQQGSEVAPIGISTRMMAGVWWFFTLIMISSYTANLSAFLTVQELVTPFKNVDELANQKEVKYGAKRGGATANYFRDSKIASYKKIWKYMEEHPEVMTADNNEGVTRVTSENYAFLMESTSIEYITERNCSLAQVGGLLDDKGYGIAMKKDSPYRNALSQEILKLQESGVLAKLKIKWWKEERGGGNCGDSDKAQQSESLSLKNVGGVFLVLGVGSILALICTALQHCMNTYKQAKRDQLSFKQELLKEMKFVMDIRKLQKPAKQNSTIYVNNIK